MRSNELGDLLRARRAAVSPRSVGLSTLAARRSAGLTRGDVAELAGISESYYARIEQGRCVPSESIVDALANVLRLEADDRARLFRIVDTLSVNANGPVVRSSPGAVEDDVGIVLELSNDGIVVGWNWLADLLFAEFALLTEKQRSIGALVSSGEGHLAEYSEITEVLLAMAGAVHALADRNPATKDIKISLGALLLSVPGFGAAWDGVDGSEVLTARFWHPAVGEMHLSCSAEYADTPRRTILRFRPSSDESSDALILLQMLRSQ